MKVWFRLMKGTKLIKQDVIEDETIDTRTHKVMNAIEAVCLKWDMGRPYWLKNNERDFMARAKTRFTKDNFIEDVEFDYMEISILEEDFL